MCCKRMCGVEVLLGYCCDKPGELWSRSASPALPSSPSTGVIWHAVPGDADALWGSGTGSDCWHGLCPCLLPSGDPCLRSCT